LKTADISVTLIDSMGSDLSVVNAARVSFEKVSEWDKVADTGIDGYDFRLSDKDKKLISYLATHKHTSPFNHCFASFRVKAPIFVARQLVKHKFMPWNEVSRRYVDSEPEFYCPDFWRARAENVKQGSSNKEVEYIELYKRYSVPFSIHCDVLEEDEDIGMVDGMPYVEVEALSAWCLHMYQQMIKAGVCPEQARMVLPQNTMTEWIWSGTLGAFADMCRLRLDPHAQYESRLVAQGVAAEMAKLYPVSWKALLGTT
jgi:thymidylate synthase (FAD)